MPNGNKASSKNPRLFKILTLDGGGTKGFYSLGVLRELEANLSEPIHEHFDLIYGTSTGAIIGALISLGYTIEEILVEYRKHIPTVTGQWRATDRSQALEGLGSQIFGSKGFEDCKTRLGVVTTNWTDERPTLFKSHQDMVFGKTPVFEPGFGAKLRDAVIASCSAKPFFELKSIRIASGQKLTLGDGGFSANNPSQFALIDATAALGFKQSDCVLLSVGCGSFPRSSGRLLERLYRQVSIMTESLETTLEVSANSTHQLLDFAFPNVRKHRVSDKHSSPKLCTSFLEKDLDMLDRLYQAGSNSFRSHSQKISDLLICK